MRRNFCGKHNNLKLFDGSSPKKLYLDLECWFETIFRHGQGWCWGEEGWRRRPCLTPALRCDEWNPPAQSEVLVKDGGGEEGDGGVREGETDGPHLLTIPDGDGREQSHVQVGSNMSSIIIYERANVWGKVFSFQWNWHCLCCWFYCSSSHCLVLSVISMQASPPATQRGKFNSNTYLPILENPKLHAADRLSNGAGGSAPCGNYSGKSCFATPSSSFSSPWSTGISQFVIFNIFIGIYTVYTGHIIVIFGTLMIW